MVGRRDARRLKPAAQELLRRQAVAAVRGGMTQAEAARVFGASERAVNEWMARSRAGGSPAGSPNVPFPTWKKRKKGCRLVWRENSVLSIHRFADVFYFLYF